MLGRKKRQKIIEFQRKYKLCFSLNQRKLIIIFFSKLLSAGGTGYALVTYQYNPPGSESGHELIDALSVGPALEVDVLDAGIDLKTYLISF